MKKYLHFLKGYRTYLFILVPFLTMAFFWYTDPDRLPGHFAAPSTELRIQLFAWSLILVGVVYMLRKAFVWGDSKEAWSMIREGNVAAGLWAIGVCILTGLIFIGLCISSKADGPPDKSLPWLPVLQQEALQYWPGNPSLAVLAAQPEQETCPSLHSKGCWNPHTGFKTSREEGIGLGQITITSKYDNLAAARGLDSSLENWTYAKRYDGRFQLRAMILMDKGNFNRLKMVPDINQRNKMALSAYNGGLGGLLNDRRLCASIDGCDPNQWDENVELHSLKSKVKYKGYGKSFFEINREYPRNIYGFRADHYRQYFNES